ncbi:hypothetical protein D3C73_1503650 [compost metagenome]
MRDMTVGAFGADTFGILEVDAALIFSEGLLHGVTRDAKGGIARFMEHGGCTC